MGCMTGNEIADQVAEINLTGNVIPAAWFQTVCNDKGKPYLLAIMILSEVVYWYRPSEARDTQTGEFLGWRTKFKGDLLQKSYQSLADYYQVSKRQVTDAVVFLEKIGVIRRVFRSVRDKKGMIHNNVLFIQLVPEQLRQLTYPGAADGNMGIPDGSSGGADIREENTASEVKVEENTAPEVETEDISLDGPENEQGIPDTAVNVDNVHKNTPLSRKNVRGSPEKTGQALPKKRETYTKNTKEINSILSKSVCPSEVWEDRMDRFRKQVDYDGVLRDYGGSDGEAVLDLCCDVAVEILVSGKEQVVNGVRRPAAVVQKLLEQVDYFRMKYVIRHYMANTTEVRNVRAYLLSCMINSVYDIHVRNANNFARFGGGCL